MRKSILAAALVAALWSSTAASAAGLVWGVCGHPQTTGLWSDWETELATLEQRGLKTYRFDIALTQDNPGAVANLQQLLLLAAKHHVTLHPILYVPFTWGDATDGGRYPATDAGLEAQGYNRVFPYVQAFAGQIQDWELENELTLRQGFKSGVGLAAGDYATNVAHQWAMVLHGMARAVHDAGAAANQPLRTVVDTVYVDLGFFSFLQAQGVGVDKLAYHYYYGGQTSPYKIYYGTAGASIDLFASLGSFNKPVIINEFNAGEIYAPAKGLPYDDAKALASLKTHAEFLSNQSEANIEGVEFYELYNEPTKDAVESNFGLMTDPTHPRTQMLLAAVYACGQLSTAEQAQLVSSGLFTPTDLATRLAACNAAGTKSAISVRRR